jgi:hypothetical protein
VRRFDVFNGDADGICALRQLRLAYPAQAERVTGLKHDIALLDRVEAGRGDEVTVLDLSLERNRAPLGRLLDRGAEVRWFDHHDAGAIPAHPGLRATIDASGEACTSELLDRFLGGRFRAWAVVGAFGDGLHEAARRLGSGIEGASLERLRVLGEALNYNAYGATRDDVLVQPEEMVALASRYHDPMELIRGEGVIAELAAARVGDMELARRVPASRSTAAIEVHRLPDARWSRRVQGTFANARAREDSARAHALVVPLGDGAWTVSVRIPHGRAPSAARFCSRFALGGGRATAAGVRRLDDAGLGDFLADFERTYGES